MELMQQLETWNDQLARNPDATHADVDVAKRLLKHGIETLAQLERLAAEGVAPAGYRMQAISEFDAMQSLLAENERMRETLRGIAEADWRKWEELASPDEFVRWAKSRAMHAMRPNT